MSLFCSRVLIQSLLSSVLALESGALSRQQQELVERTKAGEERRLGERVSKRGEEEEKTMTVRAHQINGSREERKHSILFHFSFSLRSSDPLCFHFHLSCSSSHLKTVRALSTQLRAWLLSSQRSDCVLALSFTCRSSLGSRRKKRPLSLSLSFSLSLSLCSLGSSLLSLSLSPSLTQPLRWRNDSTSWSARSWSGPVSNYQRKGCDEWKDKKPMPRQSFNRVFASLSKEKRRRSAAFCCSSLASLTLQNSRARREGSQTRSGCPNSVPSDRSRE